MLFDGQKAKETLDILTIHVGTLRQGPLELDRRIPLEWLTAQLESCEYPVTPRDVTLTLTVESSGNGILIRGAVDAQLTTECAVCLSETVLRLHPEISAFLQPKPKELKDIDNNEITLEELETEWFDGDTINVSSLVRDTLMLALPMNPKCQNDCPGLHRDAPPAEQTSIDPRLLPLAKFQMQKEK